MVSQKSFGSFLNSLNKKQKRLVADLDKMLSVVIKGNDQATINVCSRLIDRIKEMHEMVAESERPFWSQELVNGSSILLNNISDTESKVHFLKGLMNLYPVIINYQWRDDSDEDTTNIDIDTLYEHYRDESKLPELFDNLLNTLDKIISSGQIDSIEAIAQLTELINLIKTNKTGSYSAAVSAIKIAKVFPKKFLIGLAKSHPTIGAFIDAYQETVTELDSEIESIRRKVQELFEDRLKVELPFLGNKPPVKMIENQMDQESEES